MKSAGSVLRAGAAVGRISERTSARLDRVVGSAIARVRTTKFWQWVDSSALAGTLRRHLSLRMAAAMTAVGAILFGMLFAFVSSYIRSELFDDRRDSILADAATRVTEMQSTLDQAAVTNSEQVQDVAYQLLSGMQASAAGAGSVGVMLLRAPNADPNFGINEIVEGNLREVISTDMRTSVARTDGQHWQSVAIPLEKGGTAPGIVVGAPVQLPLAGPHEVYFVYTLAPEENTVVTVMRVLTVGSAIVVVLLAILTWGVTYTILLPVRQTASAAEHIADGELDARVTVDGEDELAVLGLSFNDMADSLERQLTEYEELARLQQRFVSDVSHELRTPLTTIRMAADLIFETRDDFDPMTKRSTELMHAQIERMEQMLADLLEISRFDAHAASLDADSQDLREVVAKTVEVSADLAERLGVELRVGTPTTACTAELEARRIERVLRNLLFNAIEHAEGKPVDIQVGCNETAVAVRVRDHGIGMNTDVAKHVFDRFFRADPARARTTGGTGLGLAIAMEDVNLHDGQLLATGSPGHGSAFLLILPRFRGTEIGELPVDLVDEDMAAAQAEVARIAEAEAAVRAAAQAARAAAEQAENTAAEPTSAPVGSASATTAADSASALSPAAEEDLAVEAVSREGTAEGGGTEPTSARENTGQKATRLAPIDPSKSGSLRGQS